MSEELPSIATKDAECYIDFEFQVPFFDALNSRELLAECIATATNEVLQPSPQNLQIRDGEISIEELMLRPNESTPRFLGVVGWIRCKDRQRQIYMEALQVAQKNRKISKRLAEQSNISRNKIQLAQFNSHFSNADHVRSSFLDRTVKDFNEFKKRRVDEEKVQPQADDANANANANDSNNNQSNNANAAEEDEKKAEQDADQDAEQEQTPEPRLESRSSVVVNDNIMNDETVEVDEHHQSRIPTIDEKHNENEHDDNNDSTDEPDNKQPQPEEHESAEDPNDASYQMMDAADGDDQSSNEEQKTVDTKSFKLDALASPEVDTQSGDDFSNISPRMPHLSPLLSPNKDTSEVARLKAEVADLKRKHQEELEHFTNKFNSLRREKQNDMKRQKSRLSMQIDEEIVTKEFAKKTEDKVFELETELLQKQKEQNNHLQQITLQHQTELQKFDYKLRQTQQLHALELNNIRSQHTFETEQLQKQIRALTGSLERESQKDRKINELTDENEKLKADKDRLVNNYELTIKRMNEESESNIQGEIDKRVKETAILRRELNEMKQRINREQSKRDQLQTQLYQLQNQNEEKDRFIAKIQSLYQKEKAKASKLQHKVSKSKRNLSKEESKAMMSEKDKKKIESGHHVRKPSKGLKNRTVTVHKLADTGETVVEIEKNKEIDLAAMSSGGLLQFDGDEDDAFLNQTDSEYEDDDAEKDKKVIAEKEHNEEIALKNQEIEQLKEKISNLESNIEALKVSTNEELQATQQKIGSLQQQLEQEQENFLKQNQMLEFKLKKKEGDNKVLEDQLQDLRYSHKRELRNLRDEIEKLQQELTEKDDDVASLEQHLDMVQEENARLKEYEEDIQDYEADMAELDEHYRVMLDEIKRQNQETQDKLNNYLHQKDEENDALKSTVHAHTETITELKSLLELMKKDELDLSEKEKRLQDIIAVASPTKSSPTKAGRVRESRESRELNDTDLAQVGYSAQDENAPQEDMDSNVNVADDREPALESRSSENMGPVLDEDDSNINGMNDGAADNEESKEPEVEDYYSHQGQGQAEPQPDPDPDPEAETERPSLGSMATDYIYKDEVDEMIERRVEEMREKLKMQHALAIDTVESKHKQKYESMEEQHLGHIEKLKQDQERMANELQTTQNELRQSKQSMERQLSTAEESRIKLLTTFMKEMDRMRDEIRRLNSGNPQNGKFYSKSAYM
eukprot:CAMPEP_0197027260 /NCGR_PEP_ID=MMETSP1384-20130603/7205_1 /TAXON_ID=29189 /ORGANISM="Ammonia sp." /LENGTH=1203 /DNA_ID=CAMNT_0042456083 /DNA_START=121 /DNA_END=3732 /DNA_ORIENTATION=-